MQSLNMNNNFMLQNYIENGNTFNFAEQKPKKSSRTATQELELQIATVFNEVCQLLEEHNINLHLPEDITKTTDKVYLFKNIVEELIQSKPPSKEVNANESNIITCLECQTYETNLQKLQNEVRQHIRLEQQFKIFQDTQQQKLDEYKKQKKEHQKKIDTLKKQLEDTKALTSTLTEKTHKLQLQNQHYKKQIRQLKRSTSVINQEPLQTKRDTHKQSAFGCESKQNKIDWVHRNISLKKEDKEKAERRSIQKRNDSAQKNWRLSSSNNNKSNKMISVMNDKLIQQKSKEERRKAIHSKFDYRR